MSNVKKILYGIAGLLALFVVVQFVNAAKYQMVVNVVDGENVMGVNPLSDNLDFGDLSRSNGMTRYVSLKSSGGLPTYVATIKVGEIADLVKVDKQFFALNAGEEQKIGFELTVPQSAASRKYGGWVMIFRLPKLI